MSQEAPGAPGAPENLLTPEQVERIKNTTLKPGNHYKDKVKKTCWIYVCTYCEAIYRDEPITRCDCLPHSHEQGWYKTKITYWVPEKP